MWAYLALRLARRQANPGGGSWWVRGPRGSHPSMGQLPGPEPCRKGQFPGQPCTRCPRSQGTACLGAGFIRLVVGFSWGRWALRSGQSWLASVSISTLDSRQGLHPSLQSHLVGDLTEQPWVTPDMQRCYCPKLRAPHTCAPPPSHHPHALPGPWAPILCSLGLWPPQALAVASDPSSGTPSGQTHASGAASWAPPCHPWWD